MMLRAACAACLLVVGAHRAAAQTHPEIAPAPAAAQPVSRYDFHLSASALNTDLPPFKWETHFGGDLDVFDYVVGRTTILADLEAVLGDEFRPFDPNQNNYTLEASTSARLGTTEVAAMFHHVSRHLSDRPKRFAVAWNVLGARVLRRFTTSGLTIDVVASGGKVVQSSYVDYAWTGELDVLVRHPLTPRTGLFVHGIGEGYAVDEAIANRGRQLGGRFEAGLRISGRAGAVELFAGAERRVDANPIDRIPRDWALAGFRLVSK
jgi:hypothetical protein